MNSPRERLHALSYIGDVNCSLLGQERGKKGILLGGNFVKVIGLMEVE